jgi:hypothetical protein
MVVERINMGEGPQPVDTVGSSLLAGDNQIFWGPLHSATPLVSAK